MRESGITFDFAEMKSVVRQDSKAEGGHQCWAAIDFRCETDAGDQMWIEVKSFDLKRFPARLRGGKQREFVGKIRSGSLAEEIRGKFLGTAAYLGLTGELEAKPILFVAIIVPPRDVDKALLGALDQRLSRFIQPRLPWIARPTLAVMDLQEWNQRFPEYEGTKESP